MSPYVTYNNSDLEPTNIYQTNICTKEITGYAVAYSNNWSYGRKKETLKERKIRQRLAFKMFFNKPTFTPINKCVFVEPSNIESCNRVDKFKIKSLNLIQKNIN